MCLVPQSQTLLDRALGAVLTLPLIREDHVCQGGQGLVRRLALTF